MPILFLNIIKRHDMSSPQHADKRRATAEMASADKDHEFQRDGITICPTFTHFKPENTRLLARKNDIIIDNREMYDHSKGKTLILSKNIYLLVTIKGV